MPSWSQLTTGGGGQVTHIRISSDGLVWLAGTDTSGLWKKDIATGIWSQLVTTTAIPSTYLNGNNNDYSDGSWYAAIAPSNSSRIYFGMPTYNSQTGFERASVLVSTNAGATFTDTSGGAFTTAVTAGWGSNVSATKLTGVKMAVDPANELVCYVSTPSNGQFVTSDGGATWTAVPSVPASSSSNPCVGWAFDTSSTTSTGSVGGHSGITRSTNVWVSTRGSGVYRSTDGGVSFASVSSGPSSAQDGFITPNNTYYFAIQDGSPTNIFRSTGGAAFVAKNVVGDSNPISCIAPTSVAGTLVAQSVTGLLFSTSNYGDDGWSASAGAGSSSLTSPIVTWMGNITGAGKPSNYMSMVNIVEDPGSPGTFWGSYGIGVCKTTWSSGAVAYVDESQGIEQLVCNQIAVPPAGVVQACFWDRETFSYPTAGSYPTHYGPVYPNLATDTINYNWGVVYSISSPAVIHTLGNGASGANTSGYSNDSGATWTVYSNFPSVGTAGYLGGNIASVAPDDVVFVAGQGGGMFRSANARSGAATWTQILSAAFNNGGVAPIADQGSYASPVASSVGGKLRLTFAGGVGTLAIGSMVFFEFNAPTIDLAGLNFQPWQITGVGATTLDFSGITYASGVTGGGVVLGWPGWGPSARYNNKRCVLASMITSGKYYAFNDLTAAQGGGMYTSTNSGVSWTRQGTPPDNSNTAQIALVPGFDHLIYGFGYSGGHTLYFSKNDGATWNAVTTAAGTIDNLWAVAAGAINSGNDYPSIYFQGQINGVYAIWRSDNSQAAWSGGSSPTGITFTKIDLPVYGMSSPAQTLEADKNTWNKIYLGSKGNTVMAFGDSSGPVTPAFGFSVITDSGQRRTRMIGY